MYDNKKIIFIGPLGNIDDKIINQYDIVVRTNNFFSIDKKILKSTRCDVLIVNTLYSRTNLKTIEENMHNMKYVLAKNKYTYDILIQNMNPKYHKRIMYIKYEHSKLLTKINKQPLLATLFLLFISQYYKPMLLYFTGFDFYLSNNVSKFWLPGYETKQSLKYNITNLDKDSHDIYSNIHTFRTYIDKYNWVKCDLIIHNILNTKIKNKSYY